MNFIKKHIPILEWLPRYTRKDFIADLPAGISIGIMLIPQGLAYALIAKLPAIYGLYAALLPQLVYAVFGTSRQMSVGPVAMDSLIVGAGITAIASVSEEEHIFMAIALALITGVIQLLIGVFRLGFLVNFLSKPVISGFTSAAAIIIGLNQIKHLFGVDIARSNQLHILIYNISQAFYSINLSSIAIGGITIIILVILKRIHKKIPRVLIVVALGIIIVQYFELEKNGVIVVGLIPKGLPKFTIPTINTAFLTELITLSGTLALIAIMEAISIAKALQEKKKDHKIDPNQELIAIGLGNIIGSFFQSYPTTGSFSRSAVNEESGASTKVSLIIAALIVGLTLLFFTRIFYFLPTGVLAAIILVSVFGFIDIKYPKSLYHYKRDDLLMLMATFIITLTIGIKEGILVGVLLSIVFLIYRSTRPHIAQCEQIKGTNYYKNINRFDNLVQHPEALIFRLDGQLYFANTEYFKDALASMIETKGKDLKLIVWNAEAVNHIDSSAILMLGSLIEELRKKQILFAIAGATGPIRDLIFKSKLSNVITEDLMFAEVHLAMKCLELDTYKSLKENSNTIALQRNKDFG